MKRVKTPSELARLRALAERLAANAWHERIAILSQDARVQAHGSRSFDGLDAISQEIAYAVIAIGQGQIFSRGGEQVLIDSLKPVHAFYDAIGGIVGYQAQLLELLSAREETKPAPFERPPAIDIRELSPKVWEYILGGVLSLPHMAELYPVGGAADRLSLTDPRLQIALPAARLQWLGSSLLESMIEDLQAREYLYYKLFGIQLTTPIAMMTSLEKDNHAHIVAMCKERGWFGRPEDSFFLFHQPLVPTMGEEGKWCQYPDGRLLLKPGGHGMIWKMAQDVGAFDWLGRRGRSTLLVRQINNPIAGCDYGLLAFCGAGFLHNRAFGFASCAREKGRAEGVNVLVRGKLMSIEYCNFKVHGIDEDADVPTNTNILFARIDAVDDAARACPFPGRIAHWKRVSVGQRDIPIARVETTMQNIADGAIGASAFLTLHHRRKTISTTKRKGSATRPMAETPESCFYDYLSNGAELLSAHAGFTLPKMPSKEEFWASGPPFLFFYHPALGPLFSLIGQKVQSGHLAPKSELDLQIAEACIENLELEGSLRIQAECVMGHREDGLLRYGERVGRCHLRNVRVRNRGIDWLQSRSLWKKEIRRKEECYIFIEGDGEFVAEDVEINGDFHMRVRAQERVHLSKGKDGGLKIVRDWIKGPSWTWVYNLARDGIVASRRSY